MLKFRFYKYIIIYISIVILANLVTSTLTTTFYIFDSSYFIIMKALYTLLIFLTPIIGFGQTDEDYNLDTINQEKGDNYYNEGNYTEAIKYYTKAIENSQFWPPLYINRALAKAEIGEINSAIDDINFCIDIVPAFGRLFYYRGFLFLEYTEKFDSAISDFLRAIEYEEDGDIYYDLGLAKEKIGDLKGACIAWEKAAKFGYKDASELVSEKCN